MSLPPNKPEKVWTTSPNCSSFQWSFTKHRSSEEPALCDVSKGTIRSWRNVCSDPLECLALVMFAGSCKQSPNSCVRCKNWQFTFNGAVFARSSNFLTWSWPYLPSIVIICSQFRLRVHYPPMYLLWPSVYIYAQPFLYNSTTLSMRQIDYCRPADKTTAKLAASPGHSTICFILGYIYWQIGEVIVCEQRPDTVSSVCPHLCPQCLTLCFWQFAPIVQHFLMGGTRGDWAQSTAKECDIPF